MLLLDSFVAFLFLSLAFAPAEVRSQRTRPCILREGCLDPPDTGTRPPRPGTTRAPRPGPDRGTTRPPRPPRPGPFGSGTILPGPSRPRPNPPSPPPTMAPTTSKIDSPTNPPTTVSPVTEAPTTTTATAPPLPDNCSRNVTVFVEMESYDTPILGDVIPSGSVNVAVTWSGTTDTDLQLWDGDLLVIGWNGQIYNEPYPTTLQYKGMSIFYSGFESNGGNERMTIQDGETTVDLTFKAYAFYKPGSGTANIQYSRTSSCRETDG